MSKGSRYGLPDDMKIGGQQPFIPHRHARGLFPSENLERRMPKTLAFSIGYRTDPFTNFEKCLTDSRVWDDWWLLSVGPRHIENRQPNFPWYVARKRGCDQPVNKWPDRFNIGRKVARNGFSIGFEAAGYPVFETGPGLVMRETQLPQLAIDPTGEGQLNQSSIVV